jgi:cysteine desulfurase/selenocysteine lyase
MDTNNINLNGLPSAEELGRLANAYFSSHHTDGFGASPQQLADPSILEIHTQNHSNVLDLNEPALTQQSSYHSLAGSGDALSAADHIQRPALQEYETELPHSGLDFGELPASEAGSGISPSVTRSKGHLPLETDSPFEADLKAVLNQMISYIPSSQLPEGGSSAVHETAFYFLSGGNYFNRADLRSPFENRHTGIAKPLGLSKPPFDINLIRQDFPILQQQINGKQLVWLDNAATTQKPRQVIERLSYFYENENSNIHRAAHELAARATDAYESARKKVQHFLNAASPNEIVFVRGTTEAINLVAQSWGDQFLKAGDEIILSHLEHHANIVPWQLLAKKKGLVIRVIPVDDDGQLILAEYAKLLNSKTKLVSFTQVSNALGTVTPAKQIVEMAHSTGAKVLVDGAQSVSHMRTDVQALNADWFVFSGHKVFGPTGIGALYGKEELLNQMQPWQGGGNMIKDVTFEKTEFHPAPSRFEAGTGNIADAVGLGAAIDYVTKLGIDLISLYEHALLEYGTAGLKTVQGIRFIGTAAEKASVMSFVLDGFTNDEVGQALNKEGIAVRTGHHCAQPILRRFGVEGTIRPSLAFYNTCSDVDLLVETLHRLTAGKKSV